MTIVSTSTSAFFDKSITDMASLRSQAEKMQNQMSSGNKLQRSSDDPVAASRLRMLQRADSLSQIDSSNANRATADLNLADSAMSSFVDYINRAKELATQAASGTITADQRASLGQEMQQIYNNMVSLANSRDSAGHALFGGESAGDAYTLDASGNATYAGTASAGNLSLGDGQSISRGLTGPEFLNFSVNGTPTDLLSVVKGLADDLQGGSSDPQTAARDGMTALDAGLDKVTTGQTVVGTRLNWIDTTTTRRTNLGELRANEEQTIGGIDIATTVAQLQETTTVLEASQAGFAKLANLSLFNSIS
jgi:flagellar hook-associated protein 3 FlgL